MLAGNLNLKRNKKKQVCVKNSSKRERLYHVINKSSDYELLVEALYKKIKIKINRRFDVSNIILKIEDVYANVKVVMRELR